MSNCISRTKFSCTQAFCNLKIAKVLLILTSICFAADGSIKANNAENKSENQLYNIVVQGILDNCRKLECGVLTWQTEQETHEQDRVYGFCYTCKMWWDREKVAINATNWNFSGKNEEGSRSKESTHIKAFDGNEFRFRIAGAPAMTLLKEPRYNDFENFLRDYGWPGYDNSIIKELAGYMENEKISLEWSIVESDGAEKIIMKKTYNDIADYYQLKYFDPAKGCMKCKHEGYRNNELIYRQSWKLEEVSPGIWFPVESDQYGKIDRPNVRSLTYTTKLSVDLEKSSFNDRSAIPDGVFKLEIAPDIDVIYNSRDGETPKVYSNKHAEKDNKEQNYKATGDNK